MHESKQNRQKERNNGSEGKFEAKRTLSKPEAAWSRPKDVAQVLKCEKMRETALFIKQQTY